MKRIQLLIWLLLFSSLTFAQINKIEVFQVGTKLSFFPGQCNTNLPQAQGKLSFCDKGGNLGIVERSYGLSYRGVDQMLDNHQNQDEVYLNHSGISIRKADGTWENIPHIAIPPYDFSGTTQPIIQTGLVTPSGKMLITNTNNNSQMAIYDRITKQVTTKSFPQGKYPRQFVYDTDRNLTWVFAFSSNMLHLYTYQDAQDTLNFVAAFSNGGNFNLSHAILQYKNNHIYLGNTQGLTILDVSDYTNSVPFKHYNDTTTPGLPFASVNDLQLDTNGALWLACSAANSDGGLVKFNTSTETYESFPLPLESNPAANHAFKALAINDAGEIWATATNYAGLVHFQLDGTTPNWSLLSKDSVATLGFPYTYVPKHIYFKNNQFYFTTNDGSSGQNNHFEVLINQDDVWSGRSDNENGNLSYRMHSRFTNALPDDDGGVWWFNSYDNMVVYRDKNDDHQHINVKIGPSAAIDSDNKAILKAGSPSELVKIDFPSTTTIQQAENAATGMQRVGNQIWVYGNTNQKIDVYENNSLIKTYLLDSDDYQYYHPFSVDDANNAWFMRSNGTGGYWLRRFNTTTLTSETFNRPEQLGGFNKIIPGPNHAVWFIGGTGVLLYKDGNWYPFLKADYPELINIRDAVVDEYGKLYILVNDLAAIITLENPTSGNPILTKTKIEGNNSVIPELKHYRPYAIVLDSEGSIWTHASQNAFKLVDDDLAKSYQVPLVVANEQVFSDFDLDVYPNPSSGQVTISSKLELDRVEIYSALGQRIFVNSSKDAINLQLPVGIYTLKAYAKKKIAIRKLVVQ